MTAMGAALMIAGGTAAVVAAVIAIDVVIESRRERRPCPAESMASAAMDEIRAIRADTSRAESERVMESARVVVPALNDLDQMLCEGAVLPSVAARLAMDLARFAGIALDLRDIRRRQLSVWDGARRFGIVAWGDLTPAQQDLAVAYWGADAEGSSFWLDVDGEPSRIRRDKG